MPSFKPKSAKKIHCDKHITTIDDTHSEFVGLFEEHEKVVIPKLKAEKQALMKILQQYSSNNQSKNNQSNKERERRGRERKERIS